MASGRIQITFDCADPARLATFWAAVLEYAPPDIEGFRQMLRSQGMSEDLLGQWCAVEDPTGERPRLFFQKVPEPKVAKNRVHIDVAVGAGREDRQPPDIDAEVERVIALGARKVRSVTDEAGYFVVMQDPEGNEFCID